MNYKIEKKSNNSQILTNLKKFTKSYKIHKNHKIHKNSPKPQNHKIDKTYLKKKRISFYSLVSLQDYKSPFFSAGHVGNFVVIK